MDSEKLLHEVLLDPSTESEKLHIKLGISGTYWKKVPHYKILFNGDVIKEADISQPSDTVEYIEFEVEHAGASATIGAQLTNKEDSDTVLQKDNYDDPDNYTIISDMLLNVVSLEIEEIDLSNILYNLGVYTVDKPVVYNGELTNTIKHVTCMGWNGVWSLTFGNPFYIWLLENL